MNTHSQSIGLPAALPAAMEFVDIAGTSPKISRVALGTWEMNAYKPLIIANMVKSITLLTDGA